MILPQSGGGLFLIVASLQPEKLDPPTRLEGTVGPRDFLDDRLAPVTLTMWLS
jgi:hypothetical protein